VEPEIRPEVLAFAQAMENVLRQNDYKGGWKDNDRKNIVYLMRRLYQEIGEVEVALQDEDNVQTRRELVDVANFCMMLWDNLGGN
jgi:NTP pyrophosphatase (non-canonical NTP hydrolase)